MGKCMTDLVNHLMATGNLSREQLTELLQFRNQETTDYLLEKARMVRAGQKKDQVEIWGRIPLSSYCRYDCKMCGLRRENQFASRYRMTKDEILRHCYEYSQKGIHHFFLESGDDVALSEDFVSDVVHSIKKHHKQAEVILSLGERTDKTYEYWKIAGATGYVIWHISASDSHFKKVASSNMSLLMRKQYLWKLREKGYEVGNGCLIGMPYQNLDNVVDDILFIKEFGGDIINVSPFIPALRTPFERERSGNGQMVIYIMAILRLMLPKGRIVADPTLECVLKRGRIQAFQAGCDVLLTDIDNVELLEKYHVYDRRNGRMALPPEDTEKLELELNIMGLSTR